MKEFNVKLSVFGIMILAMTSVLLSGCDQSSNKYVNELKHYKQPPDTDVTTLPAYNFSSFAGTLWKTKVRTALADATEYTGVHHIYLLVPKDFDPTLPGYMPGNDTKILTEFSPGARLRIEELIRDNGEGSIIWVTGTLEEGTNSPEIVYLDFSLLAKNRFISAGWSSSTNWGVNPDMLEAVTNAP